MSRLPTVAVVIDADADAPDPAELGAAGAAAMLALVDSGLEALAAVTGGGGTDDAARAVARVLGEFGLADRLTVRPGPLLIRSASGGRPPFTLSAGGTATTDGGDGPPQLPARDAIVLVGAPASDIPPMSWDTGREPAQPQQHARPVQLGAGLWSASRFYGGVFHTDLEGVFRVSPDPALAGPQGRWIGEYLRGRYLLPPRSVMVRAAGRTLSRRYLRTLARELRRGHARASSAGYPLPVPSRTR